MEDGSGEGWLAQLSLEYASRGGKSALVERRHRGPLLVQRAFYPEGPDVAHTYLLHPPGGIVGGDLLELDVRAQLGARCLLTTPGAAKLYRSPGRISRQRQRLHVESGARVEWFPQETIVFSGAESSSRLEVVLESDGPEGPGQFMGWEIIALGRPGSGERFEQGEFTSRLRIFVDGRPLLFERQNLRAGAHFLTAPFGWRGATVSASWMATGLGVEPERMASLVERLRVELDQRLPAGSDESRALSLLSLAPRVGLEASRSSLILGRYLGPSPARAKAWMIELWKLCRPALWSRPATLPRIWAT
jgi:urease accessory protein